jgi:hypothetical protein
MAGGPRTAAGQASGAATRRSALASTVAGLGLLAAGSPTARAKKRKKRKKRPVGIPIGTPIALLFARESTAITGAGPTSARATCPPASLRSPAASRSRAPMSVAW